MKQTKTNGKTLSVTQYVLTATAVHPKAIVVADPKKTIKPLDENHKLVRRYSFDDNGGGYMGL